MEVIEVVIEERSSHHDGDDVHTSHISLVGYLHDEIQGCKD